MTRPTRITERARTRQLPRKGPDPREPTLVPRRGGRRDGEKRRPHTIVSKELGSALRR
jgi:hypothetical protein